jgi:cytochrome c oxidase subunit 2
MTKLSLRRGLAAAVLGLALTPAAAHAGWLFPESGGSANADKIWTLYLLIFILATIVFVAVAGALVWALFKFRARKGAVAAQIHGNTRLEIGWTVGAFLVLVFITVFTFATLPGIKNPPASDIDENGDPVAAKALYASTDQPPPPPGTPSLTIRVDGQQYVWRYQYPEQGDTRIFSYTDMVVPVGVTVILEITADDVVHSWWIPKLGGKMDAVPGYVNKTWFKIPLDTIPEGRRSVAFDGQCAEFCGRGHANMEARVIGMRLPDYEAWVRDKAAEIEQAQEAAAQRRRQLQSEQGGGS